MLNCKLDDNLINEPYKITYIKIHNYNKADTKLIDDQLNNKLSNINNIDDDEIVNIINDVDTIFNKYYISKLKDGINNLLRYTYIFVGIVYDEDIIKILDNITNFPDDMTFLNNYFNYDCKNKWGENIFIENYKVRFIYALIKNDDTIYTIKNYILKYFQNDNFIILPEMQYITCKLENDFHLNKNILGNNLKPQDIVIKNISNLIQKQKKYLIPKFINIIFKSYGYNDDEFNEFINIYSKDNSIIKYSNLRNNKFLYMKISLYLKYRSLTHIYSDGLINNYFTPLIVKYFDKDYSGWNNQFKFGNKVKLFNRTILNKYGNIYNNQLYIFNFENIHKYIINNPNFNNYIDYKHDIIEDSNYFNSFIIKYFPKINFSNYKKYLNLDQANEKLKYKKDQLLQLSTTNLIHTLLNNNISKDVTITDINNIQLVFSHNILIPKKIDLVNIFNELELSLDIPFVKIKDNIEPKQLIVKYYKPITYKKNSYYNYSISKNILEDWIKISDQNYKDGIINKIKGTNKNITYKLKLFDVIQHNKIKIGYVYKINYDKKTIDVQNLNQSIQPNIPIDFIKLDKDISKLNIGDKVTYQQFQTKYADVIISKKGEILFNIIWDRNNEFNNLCNNKILERFNYFLSMLKNIESFRSYDIIKIPSNIMFLNNNYYKSFYKCLIYNVKLGINAKFKISYDKLWKICKTFFYPYVDIIDEIYLIGQNIEYYDKAIHMKRWLIGKITKINKEGTYDIELIIDSTAKNIKNVESKFIRYQGDSKYRSFIKLNYKRITNYDFTSPINSLILLLSNQGVSEEKIALNITRSFDMTYMDAKKITNEIITNYKDRNNSNKNSLQSIVQLKINYLDFVNKDSINYYDIYLEGIQNLKQFNNIISLLKSIFNVYIKIENDSLDNIYNSLLENFNELNKMKFIENDEQIVDNLNPIETDFDLFDESTDEDSDGSEDSDIGIDINIFDDMDELATEDIEEHKEDNLEDIDLVQTLKISNSSYLNRLYKLDNHLFNWRGLDKKPAFTRKCQGVNRSPKVITNEEKNIIDINNPLSYNNFRKTTSGDILRSTVDCSLEKVNNCKKLTNYAISECESEYNCIASERDTDISKCSPNSQKCKIEKKRAKKCEFNFNKTCKSIKWGSHPDIQNWYICPKIWCALHNIPLRVEDLDFDGLGLPRSKSICPKLQEEFKEKKLIGFKEFKSNIRNWRIDNTTGYDIACFAPSYKGRYEILDKNKYIPTNTHSLILGNIKNNIYSFPGFLKSSPKGSPCCFGNSNNNIENLFGINQKTELISGNLYIQSQDKYLSWNPPRLGLLPIDLFNHFNLNKSTIETGELNILYKYWLRRGIKQSNNTFLSLIANIFDPNNDDKFNDKDLINLIIKNIKIEDFKSLNKQTLKNKFLDINPDILPFQNYIEYILSDQIKYPEFFMDYLLRPHDWLFKNGLILIIIEYKIINGLNKFFVDCPYHYDINDIIKYNPNVTFVFKKNNILEPIYLFDNKLSNEIQLPINKPIKSINIQYIQNRLLRNQFNLNEVYNLLNLFLTKCTKQDIIFNKQSNDFIISNLNYKILLKNSLSLSYTEQILSKETKEYNSKYYIEDNYNKIIAIITNNNTIIPIKPSYAKINNLLIYKKLLKFNNKIFSVNEENNILLDSLTLTKNLLYLKKKYNNLLIEPIGQFKNTNQNYLLTETGSIIPVNRLNTNFRKYDSISDVNKSIFNYKKFINKKFYKPKIKFKKFLYILNKVNSDFNKNYSIKNIYKINNNIHAILLNNQIYIEIETENIHKLDILDQYNIVDIGHNYKHIINDKADIIINKYFELIKYTYNEIYLKPIKFIMNDKKYIYKILLEDGSYIYIHPSKYFLINTLDNNDYLINKISYYKFNNLKKYNIYKSIYLDNRIIYLKKIKYKKYIYNKLKQTLSNYLQNSLNLELKSYLRSIFNKKSLVNSQKRREINFILKHIFNILTINEYISINEFTKKNINLNDFKNLCINNSSINCNKYDYCQKKIIKNSIKIIDIYKNVYFYETDEYKNSDKLNIFLQSKKMPIKDFKTNQKTFIELKYNQFIEISKNFIKLNLLFKLLNNMFESNTNTCKLIIYTILSNKNLKLYNKNKYNSNFYNLLIYNISEELLRNKFKRLQIFNNIKINYSKIKYKTFSNDENIITELDIKKYILNEIYSSIKKNYFTSTQIFDYASNNNFNLNLDFYKKNTIDINKFNLKKKKIYSSVINSVKNLKCKINNDLLIKKNKYNVTSNNHDLKCEVIRTTKKLSKNYIILQNYKNLKSKITSEKILIKI